LGPAGWLAVFWQELSWMSSSQPHRRIGTGTVDWAKVISSRFTGSVSPEPN